MTCNDHQQTISEFVDLELREDDEADLFGHLAKCEACREFIRSLLHLRSSISEEAMTPFLLKEKERIWSPLARPEPSSARGSLARLVAFPLAIIVVALLMLYGSLPEPMSPKKSAAPVEPYWQTESTIQGAAR